MEVAHGQSNFECVAALLLTLISGQNCETLSPCSTSEMSSVEKPKLGTIKSGLTGGVSHPLGGQAKKSAQFPTNSTQTAASDPF